MRVGWLFALLLLVGTTSVSAAPWQPVTIVPVAALAPYVGPGDLKSGAVEWWGFRCYAAANASATQAIRVKRTTDNTQTDIGLTAACDIDRAAALAFAGTDATGTGSVNGLNLGFVGGTIGDYVTGSCISAGTYIANGSSPAWTLNNSQSTASCAVTLTNQLYLVGLYDQSGGGHLLNTPSAVPPRIAIGGCPSGYKLCALGVSLGSTKICGTVPATPQPMTVTWVGERIANFTSYNVSVGSYNGSTLSVNSDWENSANTIAIYAGNNMPLSGVTDNAFHAVVGSLSSGGGASTSVLYADGLSTSATNAGNLGMNTTLCWMGDPNGVSLADAYLTEGGVWGGAFSPSDAVTNIANARTYGGF